MYVTIVVSKRFLKKKIRRETQKMLCVKHIYVLCSIKLSTPWTKKTESYVKVRLCLVKIITALFLSSCLYTSQ